MSIVLFLLGMLLLLLLDLHSSLSLCVCLSSAAAFQNTMRAEGIV